MSSRTMSFIRLCSNQYSCSCDEHGVKTIAKLLLDSVLLELLSGRAVAFLTTEELIGRLRILVYKLAYK